MKSGSSNKGTALVIMAAVFWGSMGIFVRRLSAYGFTPIQIVALRLTAAALVFALILRLQQPEGFRIRGKDIPLFLGLGLASILFFTVCYFTAIEMMSLSTAAILLYTSPIWVMLMSVLFFRERLSGVKLAALAMAFGGCVLVSGIGGGVSLLGLLIGLGSGIGYGLYSILGTIALKRYSAFTVTTYTFVTAAAGSWLVCRPGAMLTILAGVPSLFSLLLFVVITGIVTAVIPFLCYTMGLKSIEPSRAAILATVEPMVATLFGITVFHEPMSLPSAAGILLILMAVVLLNLKSKAASLQQ